MKKYSFCLKTPEVPIETANFLVDNFNGFEEEEISENCIKIIVYSDDSKGEAFENFGISDYDTEEIGNSWKENWKDAVKPFEYNGFYFRTPWGEHKEWLKNIVINPSLAFGTGSHETTRLCLQYIVDLRPTVPDNMLDIGTGSGILAFTAALKGVNHIVGFDIDADAIESAIENIDLNPLVKNKVQLCACGFEELPQKRHWDMIVANMVVSELEEVVPLACRYLSNNGIMILSGILEEQLDDFSFFLEKLGLKVNRIYKLGEWRLLEVGKK